jgi:hypothetical protein
MLLSEPNSHLLLLLLYIAIAIKKLMRVVGMNCCLQKKENKLSDNFR